MKTDKKEVDGKLIIDDLSENAHRVRRNLLIFSFVAIFYKLSGASISENGVSFYGINFQHIDENFISIGISLIATLFLTGARWKVEKYPHSSQTKENKIRLLPTNEIGLTISG